MKHLTSLALALTLASAICAQGGPTAQTATDYGVLATNGPTGDFDSVALATPIGRGLGIRAVAGSGPNTPPDAIATTRVEPTFARTGGAGIRVREHGLARSADRAGAAGAGTSDSAPMAARPMPGAHGVAVHYGVRPGLTGTVTILWHARATPGAAVRAAVDVDGDGAPDWTGVAGTDDRQTLSVTAGLRGIRLLAMTGGQAAVQGVGEARYDAALTVLFQPGGGGGPLTCTWTSNGPRCTGQLAGSDAVTRTGQLLVRFDVTGAPAGGIGVLVAGTALPRPINIGGSRCQLLIDPMGVQPVAFVLDGNGDATLRTLTRARPLSADFQVLTIGLGASGLALGSTNALNLTCR